MPLDYNPAVDLPQCSFARPGAHQSPEAPAPALTGCYSCFTACPSQCRVVGDYKCQLRVHLVGWGHHGNHLIYRSERPIRGGRRSCTSACAYTAGRTEEPLYAQSCIHIRGPNSCAPRSQASRVRDPSSCAPHSQASHARDPSSCALRSQASSTTGGAMCGFWRGATVGTQSAQK